MAHQHLQQINASEPSPTWVVKETQVKSPVKSLLFVPPRKSSEPLEANLIPKTGEVTTPCEMRFWNTGDALNADMDGKANPIRPSFGSDARPDSWVAAPRVCDLA